MNVNIYTPDRQRLRGLAAMGNQRSKAASGVAPALRLPGRNGKVQTASLVSVPASCKSLTADMG